MASLDAGTRHRDHLPALGFLGKDAKHPAIAGTVPSPTPLISPPIMYSSQPPSYPYTTPTASNGSLPSGYISPPESRRALEEEKERQVQPQRQSLPSIHEALGNDNPLSYPGPPTSAPSQPVHHPSHAPPPHSTPPGFGRQGTEGPAGPPNPFSFSHQHHLQAEASRSSLTSINTQDSRNASLHSLSSGRSPTRVRKLASPRIRRTNTVRRLPRGVLRRPTATRLRFHSPFPFNRNRPLQPILLTTTLAMAHHGSQVHRSPYGWRKSRMGILARHFRGMVIR